MTARTAISRRTLVIVTVCCLVVVAVAGTIWANSQGSVYTDDAFADADIVTVAANSNGVVQAIHVQDNAHVAKDQALVDLDDRDLTLQRDAAQDARDADKAQFDGQGASARKDAALKLADVRVAQAQLALDKARLSAPAAGYVAHRMVSVGDTVHVGQPLLAIVADQGWITANIKETQLNGVKPGDVADVTIDAFPGQSFKGHVDSLQQGAGQAFSLLPPENASGNFVRVVQRVPVKIVLDSAPASLAPGLSARVRIHVR